MEPWWIIKFGDKLKYSADENIQPDSGVKSNDKNVIQEILEGWNYYKFYHDEIKNDELGKYRWWQFDDYIKIKPDFPSSINDIKHEIDLFLNKHAKDLLTLNINQKCRIPIIENQINNIDPNHLNIFLYGNILNNDFRFYSSILAAAIRNSCNKYFPKRTVRIFTFIVCPQSLGILDDKTLIKDVIRYLLELNTYQNINVGNRPFNSVFIFQDNNSDSDNKTGYTNLEESEVGELIGQFILHLSSGNFGWFENILTENNHKTPYLTAGSLSLYYDLKTHIAYLSGILGQEIINHFKLSNKEPWIDENLAKKIINDSDLTTIVSPQRLFDQLIKGTDLFQFNPSIWTYPKGVGPWDFWTTKLITIYYKNYVKNLIKRIVNYGRLSITAALDRFDKILEINKENILKSESGLIHDIDLIAKRVFSEQVLNAKGVEQYLIVLGKIKEIIDDNLKNLAHNTNDKNVYEIPIYLREFYVQLDIGADFMEFEKTSLGNITKILLPHPVITSLFVRALYIGITMVFILHPVLSYLSPSIIDLSLIQKVPYLLPTLLFLTPFIMVIWKMNYRIIKPIKKNIMKYIAGLLFKLQQVARNKVQNNISSIYNEISKHCYKLTQDMEFIKDKWDLNRESKFKLPITKFSFPATSKISSENVLKRLPEYNLDNPLVPYDKLNDDQFLDLYNRINFTLSGDLYFWQYLLNRELDKDFNITNKILFEFCKDRFKNANHTLKDLIVLHNSSNINKKVLHNIISLSYPAGLIPQFNSIDIDSEVKFVDNNVLNIFKEYDFTETPEDFLLSIFRCRIIPSLYEFNLGLDEQINKYIKEILTDKTFPPLLQLAIAQTYSEEDGYSVYLLDNTKKKIDSFMKNHKGSLELLNNFFRD